MMIPPEAEKSAVSLALFLVEEAIKLSPHVAEGIRTILNKDNPTPDDWQALRARVLAKSYEDYDPAPINQASEAPASVPIKVLPPPTVPLDPPPAQPPASPTPEAPQVHNE